MPPSTTTGRTDGQNGNAIKADMISGSVKAQLEKPTEQSNAGFIKQ